MRPATWFALLCACALAGACVGDSGPLTAPAIVFDDHPGSPQYGDVLVTLDAAVVRALRESPPDPWTDLFALYTGDASPDATTVPMIGTYSIVDEGIRFTPRFPPVAGQPYRARLHLAALAERTGRSVAADAPAIVEAVVGVTGPSGEPSTIVTHITPSADRLPANLLRFYVHFSAPMRVGEAGDRIRLLDAEGAIVEDAFLTVPEELWDPERRRLTVLLDPGRIKRDLRPHEELGLPLQAGKRYTLVIDERWRDGTGLPLQAAFETSFTVVSPDREIPRTDTWRITTPSPGTRDPLTLDFPEPLDAALLLRLLTVQRADGTAIPGRAELARAETRWSFTPESDWAADDYRIEVRTELEDIAGNNLRRPFDLDRDEPPAGGAVGEAVHLGFRVGR